MTGWNHDKETMDFVKSIKDQFEAHKHLMPDAWYWISLEQLFLEDEQEANNYQIRKLPNQALLDYFRTDPDSLERRILTIKRLSLIYLENIEQFKKELAMLEKLLLEKEIIK